MQLIDVTIRDYPYRWPGGETETYELVEFTTDAGVKVGIGFTTRLAFGQERKRVTVFVNGHPEAELAGADDYPETGEVLGVIKKPQSQEHYSASERLPLDYFGFRTARHRDRISGGFNSHAVVINIGDLTMIARHALTQAKYAGRL